MFSCPSLCLALPPQGGLGAGPSPPPRKWHLQPPSNQVTLEGSSICICLSLVGFVFEDVKWPGPGPGVPALGLTCWLFASPEWGGFPSAFCLPLGWGASLQSLPLRQPALTSLMGRTSQLGRRGTEEFWSDIEASPHPSSCSTWSFFPQGSFLPGRE